MISRLFPLGLLLVLAACAHQGEVTAVTPVQKQCQEIVDDDPRVHELKTQAMVSTAINGVYIGQGMYNNATNQWTGPSGTEELDKLRSKKMDECLLAHGETPRGGVEKVHAW
jgi:hypothetical protein